MHFTMCSSEIRDDFMGLKEDMEKEKKNGWSLEKNPEPA